MSYRSVHNTYVHLNITEHQYSMFSQVFIQKHDGQVQKSFLGVAFTEYDLANSGPGPYLFSEMIQ